MSAADIAPDDVVVVGRVGSPYGVKGWVHLHSFTSPAENIIDYRPWLIKAKGGQWRTLTEVVCQRHKQGFIAHIDHAADREAAAGLIVEAEIEGTDGKARKSFVRPGLLDTAIQWWFWVVVLCYLVARMRIILLRTLSSRLIY